MLLYSTVYQASVRAAAAAAAANDDESEFEVIALHPEHLLLSNINSATKSVFHHLHYHHHHHFRVVVDLCVTPQ